MRIVKVMIVHVNWFMGGRMTVDTSKGACPNCKETKQPCACMRAKCIRCGRPIGNITFTVCDDCWEDSR